MLQPSSHYITAHQWWALRELRIEKDTHLLEVNCCNHTHSAATVHPEEIRMRKRRILAPGSWGAYQRIDFSEPRLLNLPIHRKALNSLTWDVWFSLINSNPIKMLKKKNSYISQLYPYLFGAVPQSYLRCCLPGLKSSEYLLSKTNSQLSGCAFFFSVDTIQIERHI